MTFTILVRFGHGVSAEREITVAARPFQWIENINHPLRAE